MQQDNFFLTWIAWSNASNFRMFLGKTVAFYFAEEHTQSFV